MNRCVNGNCTNLIFGRHKTCIQCRLRKKKQMRVYRAEKKGERVLCQRKPWSQQRWAEFVRDGGLENC